MFSEGLQLCPHAIVGILVSVEMGYSTRGGSMGGLALSPHHCEKPSVAGKRETCLGRQYEGLDPISTQEPAPDRSGKWGTVSGVM